MISKSIQTKHTNGQKEYEDWKEIEGMGKRKKVRK